MDFSRRPSARFNRGRISGKTGPAGTPPGPPPAVPVLTAPSGGATVTNGTPVTVSATSTDGDLTAMQWVLDPGTGGETVVATDLVAPYSTSWTPTGVSAGSHTLVARAVRGPQSTDSTSISITVSGSTAPGVTVNSGVDRVTANSGADRITASF